MTSTRRWLRTFAIATVVALSTTVASAQSSGERQANGHQDHARATPPSDTAQPMARMHQDVMARMAALDARIQTLATDMNMFAGELKVQAMAELLTAMVERQSLMRAEMRRMRDEITGRMMEPSEPAAVADEEPGTMCSPFI